MNLDKLRPHLKAVGRRRKAMCKVCVKAFDGSDGEVLGNIEINHQRAGDLNDAAEEILALVQGHCDAAGREMSFRCRLSALPDGEEIKQWTMRQEPDSGSALTESDPLVGLDPDDLPPNAAGLVKMALGHADSAIRLLLASQANVMRIQDQTIREQNRELQAARRQMTGIWEVYQQMMAASSGLREDTRTEDRIDQGIELIARFATGIGESLELLPKGFSPFAALPSSDAAGKNGDAREWAPTSAEPAKAEEE